MSLKIVGLDSLQKTLQQAQEAFRVLDGELTTLNFDSGDPASVESAICEIEEAIERKIAPYRGNHLVEHTAAALKEKYANEIIQKAEESRRACEDVMPPRETIDNEVLRQIENSINDLRRSDYNTFGRHIKKLARLLHSTDLDSISRKLTEGIDLNAWIKAGEATQGGMIGSAILDWPANSEEELGTVILLVDRFANSLDDAVDFSHTFYYDGNNVDSNLRNMVAQVFLPFSRDYISYVKKTTGVAEATLLPTRSAPAARKVFVVHGHDEGARESVARFLEKLGFEAIILHEQANQGRTVVEKIEVHGDVGFAVVILTPDDLGGIEGGKIQPRARQNVLLELGYFIGRLGRSRVCALKRGDIEVPSDFGGVVYETFDASGGWKQSLGRELQAAGFEVDWNIIMGRK